MRVLLPLFLLLVGLGRSYFGDARHYTPGDYLKYASSSASSDSDRFHRSTSGNNGTDTSDESAMFREPGRVYLFRYDSQSATGFAPWVSAQQAMSRFQALVRIAFLDAEGEAELRLSECVAGQLDAEGADAAQGPMGAELFESGGARMAHEQLERPVRIRYRAEAGAGFTVDEVYFEQEEPAWSRNIKKAILSMAQHQKLAKDDQQDPKEQELEEELRRQTGTIGGKTQRKTQREWEEEEIWEGQRSYTVTEIGIEGDCETVYTAVPLRFGPKTLLNITKSVNFARCALAADIAYGTHADAEAMERGGAEGYAEERREEERMMEEDKDKSKNSTEKWTNRSASPGIARQVLDRSTTIRYVLEQKQSNGQKEYGLKSAELLSQYVLKGSEAEADQAMHTVASARLQFIGAKQIEKSEKSDKFETEAETLLYNAEMEQMEGCFMAFGDEAKETEKCQKEAKGTNNGWKREKKGKKEQKQREKEIKVPSAQAGPFPLNFPDSEAKLRRAEDCATRVKTHEDGGALSQAEYADELIRIVRFCSVAELRRLQERLAGGERQTSLFADALAAAGTRNSLTLLFERIGAGEFSELKAAQMLKLISRGSGLPAPSDRIADAMLALCKMPRVHKSTVLRQTCWLGFGAIVGELQQLKRMYGRSPVRVSVPLPDTAKLEQYTKAMLEQYDKADQDGPEKFGFWRVAMLKAMGNAALPEVPRELAEIIRKTPEDDASAGGNGTKSTMAKERDMARRVMRQNAMEALRRIPSRRVHRLLLPVFMDNRETAQTRIVALGVLLQSQLVPAPSLLDQIAFTMVNERCAQVLSFAYTVMQSMAQSPAKRHRQIAQHIKSALRMAGMDGEELRERIKNMAGASYFGQFDAMFSKKEGKGMLVEMAKVFPDKSSVLPSHQFLSLTSLFNGKMAEEQLKLTICQRNIERIFGDQTEEKEKVAEEGAESDQSKSLIGAAADQLRALWRRLGITGPDEAEEERRMMANKPWAVLSLRVNNIDTIMLPIGPHTPSSASPSAPITTLKHLLMIGTDIVSNEAPEADKPALDAAGILFWHERAARVPTSIGHQLNIQQKSFLFGTLKADAKQLGRSQMALQVHPSATFGHIQKMKIWSSPFHASGVKHLIAVEANLPVKAELTVHAQQKQIKLSVRVPQTPLRLLSLHTLPLTFVGETDLQPIAGAPAGRLHFGERCRAVQNRQLEGMTRIIGGEAEGKGMPVKVRGMVQMPRRMGELKEWAKVLLASENHFSVEFEPQQNSQTPREIALTLGWDLFQSHTNSPAHSLRDFFQRFSRRSDNEQSPASEEKEEKGEEQRQQRQQSRIEGILDKWSTQPAYKHSLRASLETVGADQNKRAEFQLDGVCDVRLHSCSLHAQMRRVFIGGGVQWKGEARAHALFPEQAADLEHLKAEEEAQQYVCRTEMEWAERGQPKQSIRIDLHGAPSSEMVALSRQFARQTPQTLPNSVAHPFVNKYRMEAEWKLRPATQGKFLRLLETARSINFFNAESELILQDEEEQQEEEDEEFDVQRKQNAKIGDGQQIIQQGRMTAQLSIDPVTHRHANITIRTATQRTDIRQLQLCVPVRPLPLVRSASLRPLHSLPQLFRRLLPSARAQCRVDLAASQLRSFDGAQVAAPLSRCWTVLAKDCSGRERGQFAVMAKSVKGEQSEVGQRKEMMKKIKVITPELGIVVVEPHPEQPDTKLRVRINGGQQQQQKVIGWETPDSDIPDGIEFAQTPEGKESVSIEAIIKGDGDNTPSGTLSVRFNGNTVHIQLRGDQLREKPCGLCGNWNGNVQDEWRVPTGEQAADAKQFHRAYSLADGVQDEEGEKCEPEELEEMYEGNKLKQYKKGEEEEEKRGEKGKEGGETKENIEPVDRTVVLEYTHQVCFSLKPVKQCPVGTIPATTADEEEEEGKSAQKQLKVAFGCVERASVEAKRLRARARRGEQVQLDNIPISFQEVLVEPKRCMSGY